ncbi:hypothetical protein FORMB_01890 [Formosa sp. Hel1_33_131]|nr:hypothetical protein FORMB_01890 [Formosa sp. Hel1_33_131]
MSHHSEHYKFHLNNTVNYFVENIRGFWVFQADITLNLLV